MSDTNKSDGKIENFTIVKKMLIFWGLNYIYNYPHYTMPCKKLQLK